uniref:Uncharacterized protein n=1 Tax=Arion vulgaris TaxID=1028688 RepID=A0A0B7B3T1_9EUPU
MSDLELKTISSVNLANASEIDRLKKEIKAKDTRIEKFKRKVSTSREDTERLVDKIMAQDLKIQELHRNKQIDESKQSRKKKTIAATRSVARRDTQASVQERPQVKGTSSRKPMLTTENRNREFVLGCRDEFACKIFKDHKGEEYYEFIDENQYDSDGLSVDEDIDNERA